MEAKRAVITVSMVLFAAVAVLLGTAPVGAQDGLYGNNTTDVDNETWMHNSTDVTLGNVTKFLGRIGTFVIGDSASNPAAGPIFSGIVVTGLVIGLAGTSRVGVVSGGVLGVTTAATLSQSAGLAPRWLYGVIMLVVAFAAAAVYVRFMR